MIRSDRRFVGVGLSLVLASSLATSFATSSAMAEPAAVQKSTADALFKEGKKMMDAKDYDGACPKLAESAVLQPGGGVQLALAICHESQGKIATAYNDYREALALAKRDKRKDREDIATEKLGELEPTLSRIVLKVSDEAKAQSVAITLDGAMLTSASWGISIPVDGGTHAIMVTASGKKDRTFEVAVKARSDKKDIEIAPLDEAPKSDPGAVASTTSTDTTSTTTTNQPVFEPGNRGEQRSRGVGPYILGGVGIVALGVGGYFGIKAISASSNAKSQCPGGECPSSEGTDKNDQAKSSARIANIGIGVGVLALSGAIVWWVLSPSDSPKTETSTASTNIGRLIPAIGPGGASLGWVMPW